MKRAEKWLIVITGLVLIAVFANFFNRTTPLKHLDSVFLFESSLSLLESGHATSRSVASWPVALKTFAVPAETICRSDLSTKGVPAYNVIDNHAYTALYPISVLTALVGPEVAFAFMSALTHVLLLIVPFVFLRKWGGGVFPSLAFSLCVAFYPAWSYSAVGEYYLDRLYMPFALLSLYFMHAIVRADAATKERQLLAGFVVSAIVASLFTERAAIMMIAEIVFFLLFYPKVRKSKEVRNVLLGLLVLIGVYLFIYFKFVFKGIEGGGNILGNALAVLQDPIARLKAPGLLPFTAVNVLFIGLFVPFAGVRYSVLVLGALIPNILVSIGGAELNGWSTHYHAMYLPFIIFAASIGYLRCCQHFDTGKKRAAFALAISVYVLMMVGFLNPNTGKFEKPFLASMHRGVIGTMPRYYFAPTQSYERVAPAFIRSLNETIPQGAKVSAIEGVMPVLYKSRFLSLYPMDMDSADYLVISGTASDGKVTSVSGANSHLGPLQVEALDLCLLQRMRNNGFVLFKEIPQIGVLVFKRN